MTMTERTTITSVTDALAICSNIIESAANEVVYISPLSLLLLASQSGLVERFKLFIQKGGRVRGITDFSHQHVKETQKSLDNGVDVRHFPQYQGIFMLVGDGRESVSSMSVDAKSLSVDTPVVALWSDDPTYAEYLMAIFETTWEQAIPVAERIENLKEGPPNL